MTQVLLQAEQGQITLRLNNNDERDRLMGELDTLNELDPVSREALCVGDRITNIERKLGIRRYKGKRQ